MIDPASFPKKGSESVGVGRQYSGILGQVDNGQAGVPVQERHYRTNQTHVMELIQSPDGHGLAYA